jgi:CheY-like chemotaxis protein/Tfp pilus assembly protein PilZ
LRAELQHGNARIVTHTIEISESLAFVRTDESAFIGDEVLVHFSFPGLVDRFSLAAQVIARKSASGPGNPGGWTLGFMFYEEEERARLRRLLAEVQAVHPTPASYEYRVLLVEDNLMTREAFALGASKFLDPSDSIALDMVENGRDALDRLLARSYDLAIVDYFLPLLSGSQLIARLRRNPGLATLPIFAISIGGAEVRDDALAAGADLFLQKPIVMRDLLSTLRQLLWVRSTQPAQVEHPA